MNDPTAPLPKFYALLRPEARDALQTAVALAHARGLVPCLVGGPVRDLLLGGVPADLDVVVEGDATDLAGAVAEALGVRARLHRAFGTATLRGPGFVLDLVTARRERYPRPGALPVVEPAGLLDDLRRRDFTIHAMAMPLDGPDAGSTIDPTGGRDDLAARLIRVLHDGSFVDDPTRLLRAVRYAARLGFELEPHTRELALRDRDGLASLTPARLRHELQRILDEAQPERALSLASALGLLARISAGFVLPPNCEAAFADLRTAVLPRERPTVGWAILGAALQPLEAAAVAARLALSRKEGAALTGAAELAAAVHLATATPSTVANAVAAYALPAIWGAALAAPGRAVRAALLRYLRQTRYVQSELSPADLLATGVPRGPLLGRIAAALRDAKRDGLVSTRDDELALARREISATMEREGTR